MKYISLFLFLFFQTTIAQIPKWTYSCPAPGNNYYYRVESGIGKTEDEARKKAFLSVLQNTANTWGVRYDSKTINENFINGSQMDFFSSQTNIPINKVCEFTEYMGSKYRVWVLFQVAKAGNIAPGFEVFNNCYDMRINFQPVWRSFLFPGWGQLYNHKRFKGAFFLMGEIALLGSALYAMDKYSNFVDKSNQSFDYKTKKYYIDKSNDLKMYRNAFGIGAIAIWGISIIDISIPIKRHE